MTSPYITPKLPRVRTGGLVQFGIDTDDPDDVFSQALERPFFCANIRAAQAAVFSALGIFNAVLPSQGRIMVIEALWLATDSAGNAITLSLKTSTGLPANITGAGQKRLRDGRLDPLLAIGDDIAVLKDDGALAVTPPAGATLLAEILTPSVGWVPFALGPLYLAPGSQLYAEANVINKTVAMVVQGHLVNDARRK